MNREEGKHKLSSVYMMEKWFLFSYSYEFWKPLSECEMHTIELFGAVGDFAYTIIFYENM